MSEKLIRCVCGHIYDPGLKTGCPACGAHPVTAKEEKESVPQSIPQDPVNPVAVPDKPVEIRQASALSPDLKWKAALLGVLVLAGIFIVHWLTSSHSTTPPADPHATADSKDTAAKTTVDSALVGRWAIDVPNAQGMARWMITIKKDGSLAFSASGPLAPPPYTAVFEAEDGHFRIHSATNGWADQGTYQVPDNKTFVMNGKLGTGVWQKQ